MKQKIWLIGFLMLAFLVSLPQAVSAHCDSMDGPVLITAAKALKAGDVTLVLHWVRPSDEAEIKSVFAKTMEVRKTSATAKELADTFFFETLVRIHRDGEGAPYTGIKPAGGIEPAVMKADSSLEKGSIDSLAGSIAAKVERGIRIRFAEALKKQEAAGNDLRKKREAVAAYVEYVHFVEGINTIASAGSGHHEQAEKAVQESAPKQGCGHH
ncbi:MAG: hypothetical protein GY765_20535 [bacterium]|nr:hypothetical protein [bacterium]